MAEEIVLGITHKVNLRIFAAMATRQSEYLEATFRMAVKRLVLNAIEKNRERAQAEVLASDVDDDDGVVRLASDDEDSPLDAMLTKEKIQISLAAITDQRHREAVVLRFIHGWPINPANRTTPCLCSHFNKSARMIQIWINTAKDEMRAAMGSDI